MCGFKVPLELTVADLVAALKLTVGLTFLLDCVVGKVDEEVAEVLEVEWFRASAQVAFFVPEELGDSCDGEHQQVGADVELAPVVKHRISQVFLDDVGVSMFSAADSPLDFLSRLADEYAVASVAILPWLHYPNCIFAPTGCKLKLLELEGVTVLNEVSQRNDAVDVSSAILVVER